VTITADPRLLALFESLDRDLREAKPGVPILRRAELGVVHHLLVRDLHISERREVP
jgi:hypothetical protein